MEHPLLGKSDRLSISKFESNSSDLEDFKTGPEKLLYHEMLVLSEVMMIMISSTAQRQTSLLYFTDWWHYSTQ